MTTIPLSKLISIWDQLHTRNTGEIGFADLVSAVEAAGVLVENDCS